jgi:hypothetical protein
MITLKPPFRAEDMASLYKKVLKGIYPRVPGTYSQDLAQMVKLLLHVAPHLRPTCGIPIFNYYKLEKALKLPVVLNRVHKLFPDDNFESTDQNELLNTIRIPKNILYLSDRLPKPTYTKDSRDEAIKRNTAGQSLPYILPQRKPKQKNPKHSYIVGMGNKYKELHDESLAGEEGYMPKLTSGAAKIPRKYRVGKSKAEKPNAESLIVHNSEDMKDQEKQENSMSKADIEPPKAKLNKKLNVVSEEADKEDLPNENANSPYLHDSYLHQLVNKKNPLIKPLNSNLQKIADIYSGNYAHQILSIHKK